FELRDVMPGDYTVRAMIQDNRPVQSFDGGGRQAAVNARPSGDVPIKVINSDLDGVVVVLSTGTSISGRLVVERAAAANVSNVRVFLRPWLDGQPNPGTNQPNSTGPTSDGTFRIDNVREGEYLPTISGVPSGFYVKRMTLDGVDILGGAFKFSGTAP